jgi:hypothetical protein
MSAKSAASWVSTWTPGPFASYRRVDRKRVECRLDDAESLRAACPLIGLGGYEDAEAQLGQGGRAAGPARQVGSRA